MTDLKVEVNPNFFKGFLQTHFGSGTMKDPAMNELAASKSARREFFTDQNKKLYQDKLASMSPEEIEKL